MAIQSTDHSCCTCSGSEPSLAYAVASGVPVTLRTGTTPVHTALVRSVFSISCGARDSMVSRRVAMQMGNRCASLFIISWRARSNLRAKQESKAGSNRGVI